MDLFDAEVASGHREAPRDLPPHGGGHVLHGSTTLNGTSTTSSLRIGIPPGHAGAAHAGLLVTLSITILRL